MALPYEYQPGGNTVDPRGGVVGPNPVDPITSPFRLPSDYPSSPTPSGGWQGPIGPGGVSPGPGDFGGFDSFQPMAFGYTGGGGGSMDEFRPDIAFGGGGMDPRQRPRLGMPRQPFSRGGFVQPRQMASPMLLSQRFRPPSGVPTGGRGGFMSPGSAPPSSPGGGFLAPGGRTATPGAGGTGSPRGGFFAPGGAPPGGQSGPNDWIMQGGPWATIQELLKYGFLGPGSSGQEGFGGVFGVNPPSEIMGGVRQRAIQDAGAQERAARLGIQSRGDMDPSTYGFQALQSQLQGQQGTQRALGEADLGLRQQQLENYWRLLNNLLGAYGGIETAKYGQPKKQSGLGGLLGGIGGLVGGIGSLGGLLGGGGSSGGGSLYDNSGGRYI